MDIHDNDIPTKQIEFPFLAGKPKPKRKPFIKGPIPLHWVAKAIQVNASSMAWVLWYLVGLKRQTNDLKVTNGVCERFFMDRKMKYKALIALEQAGLIDVKRQKGKNPIVTVLQ